MSDWTESAQSAARKIMTLLSHSQEPSNEPGDRLRDRVAVLVQQAIDARADTRETGLREAAEIALGLYREGNQNSDAYVAQHRASKKIAAAILAAIPSPPPPQSGEVLSHDQHKAVPDQIWIEDRWLTRAQAIEAYEAVKVYIAALDAMRAQEKPDV